MEVTNTLAYFNVAWTSSVKVSNDRLLTLPINIRPGWKWMEVTNTHTYYEAASTNSVKKFYSKCPDRMIKPVSYPFVSAAGIRWKMHLFWQAWKTCSVNQQKIFIFLRKSVQKMTDFA